MTAATATTAAPTDLRATHRPTPPVPGPDASDPNSASGFNALVDLASYTPRSVTPSPLPVSPAPAGQDRRVPALRSEAREPSQAPAQDTTADAGTGVDRSAAVHPTLGGGSASVSDTSSDPAPRDLKDRTTRDTATGTSPDTPAVAPPPVTPVPVVVPVSIAAASASVGSAGGDSASAGTAAPAAPPPGPTAASAADLAAASGRPPVGARDADGAADDGPVADGAEVTPSLSTLLGAAQTPGAAGLPATGPLKSAAASAKTPGSASSSTASGRSSGPSSTAGASANLLSGFGTLTLASAADTAGNPDFSHGSGKGSGQGGAATGGTDPAGMPTAPTGDGQVPQTPFSPNFDAGNLAAQVAASAGATAGQPAGNAAPAPSRTVTGLASQIVQNLDSKITRFEVTLDPEGMGRVNVSVEISAKGEMSARLSFQHADSANALASESMALRQSLADAGFTLKPEDLTFQSGGQGGAGGFGNGQGFGASDDGQRPTTGGAAAFGAMSRLADLTDLSAMGAASGAAARGLDIRI